MLHWQRKCWVIHVWAKSTDNTVRLQPLTDYGWKREDSGELTIQWNTEERKNGGGTYVKGRQTMLLRRPATKRVCVSCRLGGTLSRKNLFMVYEDHQVYFTLRAVSSVCLWHTGVAIPFECYQGPLNHVLSKTEASNLQDKAKNTCMREKADSFGRNTRVTLTRRASLGLPVRGTVEKCKQRCSSHFC